MNTLMTEATFNALMKMRDDLRENQDFADQVAGVFVPWAGNKLRENGGIYYVGIATDKGLWLEDRRPKTLKDCLQITEENLDRRSKGPFWQYMKELSDLVFEDGFEDFKGKGGWSNLLKIGQADGVPLENSLLVKKQQQLCVQSLKEELAALHNTVVVFVSDNPYGVLYEATETPKSGWKKLADETGVYWAGPKEKRNLYVWGYHPKYVRIEKFWDKQLPTMVSLFRSYNFSWAAKS